MKRHTEKEGGKRKKHTESSPTNLTERIKELLRRPKLWGYSARTVVRELHLEGKHIKKEVEQILEDLLQDGFIYLNEQGRYKSQEEHPDTVLGTIDFVNSRYAYFVSEKLADDVRIDAKDAGNALDGDTVKVAIYPSPYGNKMEGEVLEIVRRKTDEFGGVIQIAKNHAFVVTDNKKMHVDIYIPLDALGKASNGDKVLVKITEWHKMGKKPVGKVVRVLGKPGEHETEMHAIMAEYNLPFSFSKSIEQAAKRIKDDISPEEINKRRDFREITTFTIDPETAKDFDDALSLRKLENGNWEVGVHIADVSHYVKANSVLDKEAYERATSVYLVDRTIPMLPERLSNELCSLNPDVDRLTFAAVFELNEKAKIISEWFGRTVIHSDRRFTYEEAQERIETKKGDFAEEINILNTLAQQLTAERFKNGAISFETPEVRFVLDEKGKPLTVKPKIRQQAHKLIEEFMLLANKRVAEFIYNLGKGSKKTTMVYRIHEAPNEERLNTFAKFVARLGYKIETQGKKMSASFNKMTNELEGKPEQDVLQNLAVRTMSKAKYTTDALGHFGLAFKHYTHFTSPIRRYPDVMVHRLLEHYLQGGKSVPKELYEEKCQHSSDRERRAAEAERASIKYKQVEFMKLRDDGRAWEGIVTGVTDFGIYVEIIETKSEGMIRMSDLKDDYYQLDAENYRIVGKHTGKTIAFGDKLQVKVLEANLLRRTIDLELVSFEKTEAVKTKKTPPKTSTPRRKKYH
ncbi:MAG: ribonuclease R [Thermonemataceae bacterium]|nr:ribonuclease R [Thermonemataceae bacterium]